MKPNPKLILVLALMMSSMGLLAQTTTVTSNPADGATGVSPSASVVFTFSAAMNTSSSSAFFTTPPTGFYLVTPVWSAGNTVLTCKPNSPFPDNTSIEWTVFGMDEGGGIVTQSGSFSTGTGGGTGGGGSGTNATTSFAVGKIYFNEQTNSAAPTPFGSDFGGAYFLTATTTLASNRTATAITVKIPGGPTQNLDQNFVSHETYIFYDFSSTNALAFEASYPQGDYVFNVTGTPSNLQATVTLPLAMQQPNAPHISNFPAAQAIDNAQPFTVKWDAFQGGTAADAITLSVSDDAGKEVFATPLPGTNGTLSGTALSVTIPAGKLAANSTNHAQLVFYHYVVSSNATYATFAYRATGTQFDILTKGAISAAPIVSNPVAGPGGFAFDVATTPNQSLKVLFSSDCSLPINLWQTLLTTNSPGTSVHLTLPLQPGTAGFFRLQNGP